MTKETKGGSPNSQGLLENLIARLRERKREISKHEFFIIASRVIRSVISQLETDSLEFQLDDETIDILVGIIAQRFKEDVIKERAANVPQTTVTCSPGKLAQAIALDKSPVGKYEITFIVSEESVDFYYALKPSKS